MARRVVERDRAAPCAAVAAARRVETGWIAGAAAAGRLWRDDSAPVARCDTPFDLASLTKPLTALLLARLERVGCVDRFAELGAIVRELRDTPSGHCSLDLLAAHRAGLVGHRELFTASPGAPQRPRAVVLREAAGARRTDAPSCDAAPDRPREFAPEYSDLGYLLLGAALERAAGADLDELVAHHVAGPLGLTIGSARQMAHQHGSRSSFVERVAPTETVAWRGGRIRGLVHDENAWVLAGDGLAGHAGAFGDVVSVLRLGMALLETLADERPAWLAAAELSPALQPRPGGSLCAGFDRRSGAAPSSGQRFGPDTFGHLGFTGTSIWIDPTAEVVGVLLTNRVCPSRDDQAIRRARPLAYDALYAAVMDEP